MPNMGTNKKRAVPRQRVREAPARYELAAHPALSLADALFTTTQQRVLGTLYGQPQRSFTVSELIARTGAGSGAVQRELAKLTASGLLTMRPVGNQKHYQPNPAAPIHAELIGIMQKTVALADVLREALHPLAPQIQQAFVFGSLARGEAGPRSDVDLMVVGNVAFVDVVEAVYPLHERLGREVNPVVLTAKEFRKRAKDSGFITRVLDAPRIQLIGAADDA
jgi:predicted nucleotidyltransferase